MSPPADLRIQILTADDVALVDGLLATFGEAFEDPETYTGARPNPGYLRRFLGSDGFLALVALRGDAVVGGIAAYVLHKIERERSEVYLYDLEWSRGSDRKYSVNPSTR